MRTRKVIGRRQFLKSSVALATVLGVPRALAARAAQVKLSTPSMEKLGWQLSVQLYTFRRYPITRPPIGVLNLGDIACMLGAIVLAPYLDLPLPL